MNSHLTTLINPYLRKSEAIVSTPDSTILTQSSQTTSNDSYEFKQLSSTNMSPQADDNDMSDTDNDHNQLSTFSHTSVNSPTAINPLSKNMYNSLMDPTKNNKIKLPQPCSSVSNQRTKKDCEQTVTFQSPNRNNLCKKYPGRGISRASHDKPTTLNSTRLSRN
jgi:hypothetical protein